VLSSVIAISLIADAPLARANVPAGLPAGIAAPFVASWQVFDGADVLGAPVSPPVQIDGRLVQFFVYGALAQAADGSGVVERYAVGVALADARHDPERQVQGRRVGADRTTEAFARDTGEPFDVTGAIVDAYERMGGAERFGAAISRPYTAGDERVQWFEYGRIVWTFADRTGALAYDGWELARALDLPTAREVTAVVPTLPEAIDNDAGIAPGVELAGFTPARIQIPSIGVDAWIEQVGIVDGVMQTPEDAWNVGWYNQLAAPGGTGNAVFAAHRDWWGIGPVVFYDLGQVAIGETVTVTGASGEIATYLITEIYSVPADADFSSVISSDSDQEITLITCTGNFNGAEYLDRLIVRGILI
jgi:LPXTG-site transpeptidase (sortase) family protein